jgi:hypothetical protein
MQLIQPRCSKHCFSVQNGSQLVWILKLRTIVAIFMFSTSLSLSPISAWTIKTPVSQLLKQYSTEISELKSIVQTYNTPDGINMNDLPYKNDIFYLRYCLLSSTADDDNDDNDPKTKLQQSLQWRMSEQGKSICTAARTAVTQATTTTTPSSSNSNSWLNNQENVFANAPSAIKIGQYITPENCITTTLNNGDLVYCIRAGAINDVALFKSVTIDEMINFFLYVKEVHALVSDIRSHTYDQLLHTITCNDLSNVKLLGGSNDFRKALSQSSTIASTIVYPSTYTGPTLLCNLPILVSALVKLFTPLFPEKVKQRLKFVQGPLSNVSTLSDIATSSSSTKRTEFVQQLNDVLSL